MPDVPHSAIVAALEHAHVGMLLTDLNGHIQAVNEAMCQMSGFSSDALIGETPRLLKSGFHDADFYCELWRRVRTEGHWEGSLRNRNSDGRALFVQLSISTLRDAQGAPTHYLGLFSDVTDRIEVETNVTESVCMDPLTGLPNRRLLYDRLALAHAACQRHGNALGVCMMDLDGFKQINDAYGHEAGDHLLASVARRLGCMLRASDTLARVGGDEFVLLLPELHDEEECMAIARRFVDAVAQPFLLPGGIEVRVGTSIGVTIYPSDGSGPEALLRHADYAMYTAKRAGKNGYQFFDAALENRIHAREKTLTRLADAMLADEFELYYQPKFDHRDRLMAGLDAVVRWNHPTLGMVAPEEFMPLIAESDLAVEYGHWAFRAMLRQLRNWHDFGKRLSVCLTIPSRCLLRPETAARFRDTVADLWPDLPPGRLSIEADQVDLLLQDTAGRQLLETLRTLGVGLSIARFGSGNAPPLSVLRSLRLDELKIEPALVANCNRSSGDVLVIQALVRLADTFGIPLVATGVERPEQFTLLIELGCHRLRGRLIAPMLTAAQVLTWHPPGWLPTPTLIRSG